MLADAEQRAIIYDVWEKMQDGLDMDPLEKQVRNIIEMHPETHSVLSNREQFETHEFESNEPDPFAHIGFHAIVAGMINTDSPSGIRSIYDRWVTKTGSKHDVLHEIMGIVFDLLISTPPDEPEAESDAKLLENLTNRLNDIAE